MACLAPNFVLLLTLVMYLSLSDGTTFSHFKTIPNFLGIVLKETQTVEVVGCIVECSYQLGSCWGIRFNVVSKQCQHLGYAMNQMNETFLSSGDWRIFRKSECPPGWIALANSCYRFLSAMGTQPLAIQKCLNAGGYLAAISSVEERTAVQTNLRSMNHWIDGSDAVQEGIWKTYNGDTISEVPFQTPPLSGSIEPNGGIISNCLFLYYNRLGDDVCRLQSYPAVCELDIN